MDTITLADTDVSKIYKIARFAEPESAFADKLHRMGFIEGTPIEHIKGASHDPMVFFIRGGRVALRKSEARSILVEELRK